MPRELAPKQAVPVGADGVSQLDATLVNPNSLAKSDPGISEYGPQRTQSELLLNHEGRSLEGEVRE